MNNYLFITNTENFKIDKKIIYEVNIFLKKEIKTDFFLRVLQINSAYEWSLSNKIISLKKKTVGVIAIDPSSSKSGGALLGDRTRFRLDPNDGGV